MHAEKMMLTWEDLEDYKYSFDTHGFWESKGCDRRTPLKCQVWVGHRSLLAQAYCMCGKCNYTLAGASVTFPDPETGECFVMMRGKHTQQRHPKIAAKLHERIRSVMSEVLWHKQQEGRKAQQQQKRASKKQTHKRKK
jgi:hypothetical protein